MYGLHVDPWIVRLYWWQRILLRSKQRMFTWNMSLCYLVFPDNSRAFWGKVEERPVERPVGIHNEFVLDPSLKRLA